MSAQQYLIRVGGEDTQEFLEVYDDDEIRTIRSFVRRVNETPAKGAAPGVSIEIIGRE